MDFTKMHGAGNDFVLVDDRSHRFPDQDAACIAALCRRGSGIGAEGLVLLRSDPDANLRMVFFNPDGQEAELCGNAARCAARLAHDLGMAPAHLTLATAAGTLMADVADSTVTLAMPDATDLAPEFALELASGALNCGFVNTGVPHVVTPVPDLASFDVETVGRPIRRHPRFQPAGTNANFVVATGQTALSIRTYERGVEAESGACGTGAVAAAIVMAARAVITPPVTLTTRDDYTLIVDFLPTPTGATRITLAGPAEYVYTGHTNTPYLS